MKMRSSAGRNADRASATGPGRLTTPAFTLIELLVVITIIALLAGLLLPALAKAKQRARTLNCLSQQQQLVLAWLMYAHDNGDKITHASAWPSTIDDPAVWVRGALDFTT